MSNLATIEPRRSVTVDMATKFGMEATAFEATLRATCIKPDKNGRAPSKEEFAAFLLVAKKYDLNPLTKEIYAFAAKGGGIVPVVSVDGWSALVNRSGHFDGMEFDDVLDEKNNLISVTCRMYRNDRSRPVSITEYMVECKRDTDVWRQWPRRMLRHKAMIQASRYAFSFCGIYDEDEGERIVASMEARVLPAPPTPPAPPVPPTVAIQPPAPKSPPAPPQAPQSSPERIDFDELRTVLKAADSREKIDAAFEAWIAPHEKHMSADEINEANATLREMAEPFWQDDGQ
jgi:phage recombination protein Bet